MHMLRSCFDADWARELIYVFAFHSCELRLPGLLVPWSREGQEFFSLADVGTVQ